MNEDITPNFWVHDKAEPLLLIKPLHCAFSHRLDKNVNAQPSDFPADEQVLVGKGDEHNELREETSSSNARHLSAEGYNRSKMNKIVDR
jgi:hypothetical protein